MLRMSSCTMTVLPVPAPPKSPIFEPLANVQMRSMTLIPVSRISTLACCSDTGGAGRWIGHRVMPSGAGSSSIGEPMTLNMRPSVSTPTGTEIGPAVAGLDLERLEQLRLLSRRKLDVDHGADHLADMTFLGRLLLCFRCVFRLGHLSALPQLDARMASAPLTISMSSVVIPAWRTLFAYRVSASIRSPAASVAFCIAIILAEYSLALFSSTAWNTCVSTYRGSRPSSTDSGSGS